MTPNGRLSKRSHPEQLGSALTHPYITTDYSEALLEFVTPPLAGTAQTLDFLHELHVFVQQGIGDELMWPSSMPCIVDRDEAIPIAGYGTSNPGMLKTVYRRGLGHRYGRAMQAIAGIHFNYSPPEKFWAPYHRARGAAEPIDRFRSESMMGLARNFRRLSWLVIYLLGASPALCKSFRPEGDPLLEEFDASTWYAPHATSLRMSDIGYRNTAQGRVSISLNSLDEYIAGMSAAVSTPEPRFEEIGIEVDGEYRQLNANILQIENEYYSSIRPKPNRLNDDRATIALRRQGVGYVEIRTLDLDPTEPLGIGQHQLRFLETLLVYCLLTESPPIDEAEQREIDECELTVARRGRQPGLVLPTGGRSRSLKAWGLEIIDRLSEVAALLDAESKDYSAALATQRAALEDPDATPSARLLASMRANGESFFEHVSALAEAHRTLFLSTPLSQERAEELKALAAASLEEQAQLEQDATPFGEYLAGYLAEV